MVPKLSNQNPCFKDTRVPTFQPCKIGHNFELGTWRAHPILLIQITFRKFGAFINRIQEFVKSGAPWWKLGAAQQWSDALFTKGWHMYVRSRIQFAGLLSYMPSNPLLTILSKQGVTSLQRTTFSVSKIYPRSINAPNFLKIIFIN